MTQHKSFKQLVRARMARTGQTYSSARRQVLAALPAASALPPGLVPGYDVFGGGDHRDSALLHNVLRAGGFTAPHTGQPWSEPMLAGLAGGIGFMYFVFEYTGHHPTMTIVTRHHPDPYIPAALRRAGFEVEVSQTSSAAKAKKTLLSTLDDGRAAVCTVDRSALPWHGLGGEFGSGPYDVVVAGVDGETLWLDDKCVRPNGIQVDDFMAAWSAYRKGKHSLTSVRAAKSEVDLQASVMDAIATMCAHLTGPVLGNNFDVNFGLSGMRRLADQLRDDRGKTGWQRRFADPEALFVGLHRLHDCLEVEFSGPSATRPLYGAFLAEVAEHFEHPEWTEAGGLFVEAGSMWSSVASLAGVRFAPLAAYYELVTERLRLQLTEGSAAAGRIRALDDRVADLSSQLAADPPSPAAVRELLDDLADRVDAARELEERAVSILSGSLRP